MKLVLLLLLLCILVVSCSSTGYEEGIWMYSCNDYDCAQILVSMIDDYDEVVCAFYDLGEEKVLSALEGVETVIYKENYEEWYADSIKPVGSKGLMHHKYCVFDKSIVLTGTWNPTKRGTYENDNMIIVISSSYVAKRFLNEYKRMTNGKPIRKYKSIEVNGTKVDALLCRVDNCEEKVTTLINSAEKTVSVLAFSFTSTGVADALIAADERGVIVEVLMEKSRRGAYSVDEYLINNSIDVYYDGNPATMHEKVFIIDDEIVALGSYNPTKNAQTRNDENLVIIYDNERIMKIIEEEYQRIKEEVKI